MQSAEEAKEERWLFATFVIFRIKPVSTKTARSENCNQKM